MASILRPLSVSILAFINQYRANELLASTLSGCLTMTSSNSPLAFNSSSDPLAASPARNASRALARYTLPM